MNIEPPQPSRRERAVAWLAGPRIPWLALGLGLLLALPSLWGGWALDDVFLRLFSQGGGPLGPRAPWDWFRWVDSAQQAQELLPWWTPEQARLVYLRPLASLSHALDFALWPQRPWLMHAQNLLWWGLLLASLGRLYRQAAPALDRPGLAAAHLALLLYAVDDARGLSAGWISGRHSLMAALAAVWCLSFHLRWRRHGWRPGAWLSAAALALGLLGSELAAATVAYVLAWALVCEEGWRRRLASVAPAAALTGLHAALWLALGAGTPGTSLVLSLWRSPWAWLEAAPSRAAALLFGQWGLVPSDLWVVVPPQGRPVLVLLGLVFGAWVASALWPMLRQRPQARFWALGSLLSWLWLLGSVPSDGRLTVSGLGAMAVIALFLTRPAQGWRARGLVLGWLLVHGLAAGLLAPLRAWSPAWLEQSFAALAQAPDAQESPGALWVVVRAPDAWSASATPLLRAAQGRPGPAQVQVLCATHQRITLERLDTSTLELLAPTDAWSGPVEAGFLAPGASLEGQRSWSRPGLSVERLRASEGQLRLRFTWPSALDAPALRWWAWGARGYQAWPLPAPGQRVTLEAVDPSAAFHEGQRQ